MPEGLSEMSRFSKVSSIFGRDAFATMRYVTLLNVSVGRNRYVVAAKFLVFFDIISNMWDDGNGWSAKIERGIGNCGWGV